MFRTLEEQSNLLTKKIEMEDSSIFFQRDAPKDSDAPHQKLIDQKGNYLQELKDFEGQVKDLDSWTEITPGVQKNVIELTSIESLIQQIFQDLNNYSECQIPIDSSNSVDIKLFPIFAPPPDINSFDVPIQTVKIASLVDLNWDPTMLKILPHINGINSVKRISKLADADFNLTRQCIQHLMHYKCIAMLDIFQFSNMYAPTSNIGLFLENVELASECQAYVVHETAFSSAFALPDPKRRNSFSDDNNSVESSDRRIKHPASTSSKNTITIPSKSKIFSLYRSLHHGQTLKDWTAEHSQDLQFIDIRRLISFGVLKSLIYRVHSTPVSDTITNSTFMAPSAPTSTSISMADRDNSVLGEADDKFDSGLEPAWKKKARQEETQVIRLMKKLQSFDAICTEMEMSRKEVEAILDRLGDWNVINS